MKSNEKTVYCGVTHPIGETCPTPIESPEERGCPFNHGVDNEPCTPECKAPCEDEKGGWEERFELQMNDWKKEIGEIPENTCPSIDKIIKEIDYFEKEVNYFRKNASKYESAEELANDLPSFGWSSPSFDLDTKLRSDNEKLRELGQFWYENCKGLKSFLRSELATARKEERKRIDEEITKQFKYASEYDNYDLRGVDWSAIVHGFETRIIK